MAIPRPAVSTFYIESVEDGTRFTSYFGDGAALVIDGYGGWSVKNRPKEIGITEWDGRNPMAIEIPFVLDNFSFDQGDDDQPNRGVETESMVHNLETLCGLGGHDQPPICKVQGHGIIPHDLETNKSLRWVVESVTWDRDIEIRSGVSQRRMRCGGMIVIRQFLTAQDILWKLGPRSRARKPGTHIVKAGETLHSIAKKEYGNPNKWKIIADANNIRDSRSVKPGKHLRIPR